ncbi:hypothetical protein HO133_007830 [Letharia lupina]|uniref:Uncharacterized protein n=1 Tax=Letharia lupina TaxID=560253 RepID=A0A8H6CR81_9LECA|nr:uncharacterized protein HO133_007830 [Letharia lupina]KAF6228102.1 hypothetical protein HO133_007830 [Letharia lupina]
MSTDPLEDLAAPYSTCRANSTHPSHGRDTHRNGPQRESDIISVFFAFAVIDEPRYHGLIPARGARKSLTPKEKIEVVCSRLLVQLIILGTLAWHTIRKRRIAAAAAIDTDRSTSSDDVQPYLQQENELEAEETRKHELHADEQRYAFAEETIHEMQDGDHDHGILTQGRPRSEQRTNRNVQSIRKKPEAREHFY